MPGTRVVKVESVDWGLPIDVHPAEFLQRAGISVYYKLDRNRFLAHCKQFVPMPTGGKKIGGKFRADQRLWAVHGFNGNLLLVRLDDEPLKDLILTGTAKVETFCAGGLADTSTNGSGEISATLGLTEVDFSECILVSKKRWRESPPITIPSDLVESIDITPSDLYVELSDSQAAVAGKEQASPPCGDEAQGSETTQTLTEERYPPTPRGCRPPDAIYWVFQAAIAFNRDGEKGISTIDWLRRVPVDALFHNRTLKTAEGLVSKDYRFHQRLNMDVLEKYPGAASLRSPYIGLKLELAMAISSWWVDNESGDDDNSRIELIRRLVEARFPATDIVDLVGMISGKIVSDSYMKFLYEKIETSVESPLP